jgi:hypothetical protein
MMFLLLQAAAPDRTAGSFLMFATVLATIVLFVYIFRPALAVHGVEKTRLAYLYERKEQTYENLRDLKFEHKAGKLSEADFTGMRDSMEQDAAALLAEIEDLEREALATENQAQPGVKA